MHEIHVTRFALGMAVAMLCACGGAKDSASGASTEAAASSSEGGDDAGGGDSPGVGVRVTFTGGPYAGTHEKAKLDGGCIDYANLGLGAAGLTADVNATGLTGVDFGVKNKSTTGTDDFSVTLTISGADTSGAATHYRLDPKKQRGTGSVRLSGSSPRYTVHITGKTEEGVGVDATIRCLG